jgi:hypothetical protein
VTYRHPLAFLLGLEGVALLRAFAGDGFDREFTEERVAEVRSLLAHAAEFGEGADFTEVDAGAGYRAWAATYDQPGNPLIDVEQPLVRQILDQIPPGRALDAACGTGRHAAYLSGLGHQVLGVDNSPEMLTRARQRVPGARFLAAPCTGCQSPPAKRLPHRRPQPRAQATRLRRAPLAAKRPSGRAVGPHVVRRRGGCRLRRRPGGHHLSLPASRALTGQRRRPGVRRLLPPTRAPYGSH